MPARRLLFPVLLLWAVLAPRLADAHRLPPEVIAFFAVDADGGEAGARLRVIVRVPTAILLDARLPTVQTTMLDLAAIDGALATVAAEVARGLEVTADGRPLTPRRTAWILSPFADTAFDRYETATARLSGPPIPRDSAIYWNEAFVDIEYEYALASAAARVTARLNGLRLGGDFFQTRATYRPANGRPRTITVSGPPQRVAFEPPASAAITTLARRGVDQLGNQRLLWLFVFCLAVPLRRLDAAVPPFAVFAMAYAATLTTVALREAAVSDESFYLAQFVAGAAVVLAAAQAIAGAGRRATAVVAAVFGAAAGLLLGSAMHELLPLSGSHGLVAILSYAVLVTLCAAAVLVVFLSLARLPYRVQAPEWLITAALCALPAHEATHVMTDVARRLGERSPWDLPPLLAQFLAHWPFIAVSAFLTVMWTVSRTASPLAAVDRGGASS